MTHLIPKQTDLASSLIRDMAGGPIATRAGFLILTDDYDNLSIIDSYTDRDRNGDLEMPDPFFIRGSAPKKPFDIYTGVSLNESPKRTLGLESMVNQLGLSDEPLTGAMRINLRLTSNPNGPRLTGIMINPLVSLTGRTAREIESADQDKLRTLTDEYQAKFTEIGLVEAETERKILTEIAPESGLIVPTDIPGYMQFATFSQQLDHPYGGDVHFNATYGNEFFCGVGDILGHGKKAAMLNYRMRMALKLLSPDRTTGHILNVLNGLASDETTQADRDAIKETDPARLSAGLTYFLDYRMQEDGSFTYSNAGNGAYIIHADGSEFKELKGEGMNLGLGWLPDNIYNNYDMQLRPGDLLYVETDGWKEAPGGERDLFQRDRILQMISDNRTKKPSEILSIIDERVSMHAVNGYDDDRTGSLAKYLGE